MALIRDSRLRHRLGLTLAFVLLCATAALAASAAAAPPTRTRIGRPAPIPRGAQAVGALSQATSLQATVTLQPRNPAALAAYAQAVSTPGSGVYRRYLSVGQFAQRFGPSASQVAAVRSALRAQGLQVGPSAANHLSFSVTGTASTVGRAFSTPLERYRLRSGHVGFANTSAPAVPSSVAGLVQGVVGLNTLTVPHPAGLPRASANRTGHATAQVATGGPQPCSAATTTGSSYGSYSADQIASAYGFSGLYGEGDLGGGVTVALYELEPYSPNDIQAYQSCYGTSATVTPVPVDGANATKNAGQGEAALDIEDVIGLAPKASIRVYSGPNTDSGAYDTYNKIVTEDQAQVISTSWGLCEPEEGSTAAAQENTLFQEAATQGQSIYAAAGDSGADDCGDGTPAVDDPASQPYVTGAGGTSMSSIGPPPSETVWNDGPGGGAGGGGESSLWSRPSYQPGTGPREVPDVSADADEDTGYTIYWNGGWTAIGGTSAAAPTWASLTALADASSGCSGTEVGFANPGLYRASAGDFNDITSGSNSYDGVTGFSAGPGYDMASGLGTPKGVALASALCGNPSDTVTFNSPPGPQTSTQGTAISPLAVSASSSAGGFTYTASNLPTGLSINRSSGVISGTPTTAGTYSVTVRAVDADYTVGTDDLTWSVDPPTTTTTTSSSTSTSSSPTTTTTTTSTTSSPPTTTTTTTSSPPTTTTTSTTTTPAPPPPPPSPPASVVTLSQIASQSGRVGTGTRLQLDARDSQGLHLTYRASGLPAGLSINSGSGLISGTPSRAGRYTVRVTAVDTRGSSATATFVWTIAGRPSVTKAALRLLSGGRARLSLTFTAGLYAAAIKSIQLKPPSAVRLSSGHFNLVHGVALASLSHTRLKDTLRLAHGTFQLTVSKPAGGASLQLSYPEITLSSRLRASVAAHHTKSVTLTVIVTDASKFTTRLQVKVAAS